MKLVSAALFCAPRSRCKINDRCKWLKIRLSATGLTIADTSRR